MSKREKAKLAVKKLIQDIKNVKWALAMLLVYYIVTRLLFHEFCPMRIVTGLPCPGCGATRAGIFVLTFQWKRALEMNPTIFLWIPYILFEVWQRYIGKKRRKLSNILLVAVCLLAIIWYIKGMINYFPNQEPYTYFEGNLFLKGLKR